MGTPPEAGTMSPPLRKYSPWTVLLSDFSKGNSCLPSPKYSAPTVAGNGHGKSCRYPKSPAFVFEYDTVPYFVCGGTQYALVIFIFSFYIF